jgi:hypothetical protein
MTNDRPEVLVQALAFHAAGCSVIRARSDGSKAPLGKWTEYQHFRPAPEALTAWFSLDRTPGMGLVCGAVSGNLELLEFEHRAMHLLGPATELMKAAGLGELWARLSAGYTEATPSGGVHFLYRVIGMPVPGNTKLARRPATTAELADRPLEAVQCMIETRGEGGFVVVAPSNGTTHPTGKPWVLLAGGPATIPTITAEEHQALHAVMRTFDRMPVVPAGSPLAAPVAMPVVESGVFSAPAKSVVGNGGASPGDDFNRRATWPEILQPYGWQEVYTSGDTTYWRRPDKRIGISATTGHGGDWLYVFSTSTVFQAERTYTKFGAYTELVHGGDFANAARTLRAQNYGDPLHVPAVPGIGLSVVDVPLPELDDDETTELYPVVDWKAAWAAAPEDVAWLCEPLIEKGRSYSLYSPPKAGKSLLALEMAAALATGRAVLGNVALPPIRVLYVDMENTVDELVERLSAMGYKPEELDNLRYLSFPSLPALDSKLGGEHLLAVAQLHEAELVFLDTVSRMVDGEENAADTYLALYRFALVPLKARGVAIMRLDHSGKDMALGQRGSSAKSGDVDAVWRMTKRIETKTTVVIDLVRTDSRNAHGADALTLTRRFHPLRHEAAVEGGPGPDVMGLVERMDELGLSTDTGRDAARIALAAVGIKARNATLSAAVRHRKTALMSLSTVRDSWASDEPSEVDFTEPRAGRDTDRESAGQDCPGQSGTTPKNGAGATADPPVPKGGSDVVTPFGTVEHASEDSQESVGPKLCGACGERMTYDDGSGLHPMCDYDEGDS